MTRRAMDALRLEPRVLGFYERFEQAVAHILNVVISVIIAISPWQLIRAVVALLLLKALNPLKLFTVHVVDKDKPLYEYGK
jgi:hypothetical protein